MTLLQTTIKEILTWVSAGGVGLGAIILMLLRRHLSNPKDRAEVDRIRADTNKIKAETDGTATDHALAIVKTLREQLEDYRKQLNQYTHKLEDAELELEVARGALFNSEQQTAQLRRELDFEREKNRELSVKLEQVGVELQRLQRNSGRPT